VLCQSGCGGDTGIILEVPDLNASDFEALGVYDPGAPHARQRLQLLEYLVSLGATADDLVAYQDGLPGWPRWWRSVAAPD
jgi:hypothetical protein